eukprot:scaffold259_cov252-Pinguiococcus_pyrenoidosus.AAC.43
MSRWLRSKRGLARTDSSALSAREEHDVRMSPGMKQQHSSCTYRLQLEQVPVEDRHGDEKEGVGQSPTHGHKMAAKHCLDHAALPVEENEADDCHAEGKGRSSERDVQRIDFVLVRERGTPRLVLRWLHHCIESAQDEEGSRRKQESQGTPRQVPLKASQAGGPATRALLCAIPRRRNGPFCRPLLPEEGEQEADAIRRHARGRTEIVLPIEVRALREEEGRPLLEVAVGVAPEDGGEHQRPRWKHSGDVADLMPVSKP